MNRDPLRIRQEPDDKLARQLDSIRERLREAVDDRRPPLSAYEVGKRLDRLYEQTVQAPLRGQ